MSTLDIQAVGGGRFLRRTCTQRQYDEVLAPLIGEAEDSLELLVDQQQDTTKAHMLVMGYCRQPDIFGALLPRELLEIITRYYYVRRSVDMDRKCMCSRCCRCGILCKASSCFFCSCLLIVGSMVTTLIYEPTLWGNGAYPTARH